jgi:hypothetical protein
VTGIAHRCNGIVRIRYLDGERWCYELIQYLPKVGRFTMDANPHYCCKKGGGRVIITQGKLDCD